MAAISAAACDPEVEIAYPLAAGAPIEVSAKMPPQGVFPERGPAGAALAPWAFYERNLSGGWSHSIHASFENHAPQAGEKSSSASSVAASSSRSAVRMAPLAERGLCAACVPRQGAPRDQRHSLMSLSASCFPSRATSSATSSAELAVATASSW